MASQRSKKHETCAHEDCGSRRFHVGEDGFTYCDQGHQQSERGTVIAEDTGDFLQLGKTSRLKDSDAESATSRASSFSGSRAFEHYLLCIQLVLRKQLHWLIHTTGLPEELETLVKDLWALRLQRVQSKIAYESETDTEAPSSQVFSSQSESEATSASKSTRKSRKAKERVQEGSPRLVETITLCQLGLLCLRIPVTTADIHKWVNDGQLLYFRAVREVPLGMRERLPARYQAQLEPQELLPAPSLHAELLESMKTFNAQIGMSPPVLNVPLVIYRWMRELMLPVEVYPASNRLAKTLAISFDFLLSSKSGGIAALQYPEARLMAILVVAVKLLFPTDGVDRHACSETNLAAICMDWKVWAKQVDQGRRPSDTGKHLSFADSFDLHEAECHSLSDEKLDAYLDWYQNNIASEDIRERGKAGKDAELRRAMFTMFPVRDCSSGDSQGQRTAGSQALLENRSPKAQSMLRPRQVHVSGPSQAEYRPLGSRYRRFRSASEIFGVTKTLYERAAELAGLSLDDMVQVVFALEEKMRKVEDRLRRQAAV